MKNFVNWELYYLKTLVKETKCFKSVDNPFCIEMKLTNHLKCFENAFMKLVLLSLRHIFRRSNQEFSDTEIMNTLIIIINLGEELISDLSSENVQSNDLVPFINISKMIIEKTCF